MRYLLGAPPNSTGSAIALFDSIVPPSDRPADCSIDRLYELLTGWSNLRAVSQKIICFTSDLEPLTSILSTQTALAPQVTEPDD
jgi:hypothetical protein